MADLKKSERSALHVVAKARRADALFKAMAADFLLREQFVTDPLQVLAEYVQGDLLDADLAALGNALVYAVVSNRSLVLWLGEYTRARWRNPPSAEELATDFSGAVVACGADDVVRALIDCASSKESLAALASRFPLFELLTMVFGGDASRAAGGGRWTDPSVTIAATMLTQPSTLRTGRFTERVPLTQPTITDSVTEPEVTEPITAFTVRQTFITGRFTEPATMLVTAATFITEPYASTDTGPTTQSTDTGPTTRGTDTGPTTRGTDTGPTTRGTDTGPTTRGTDTGPTTQATDTGPGDRFGRGGLVQLQDFGTTHWALPLYALAMFATELRGMGVTGGTPWPGNPPDFP